MEQVGSAELAQKVRKYYEDLLCSFISNFAKFFLRLSSVVVILPCVAAELPGFSAVPNLLKSSSGG